ncbi:MAG: hypothetical protein M3145_04025 [Pseudomonadota bacterium]|nr:hypothetical protein [Pseudomonadota bacterium]
MDQYPKVFALLIDGEPAALFNARSDAEAQKMGQSTDLRHHLRKLGYPNKDTKPGTVRSATSDEIAQWNANYSKALANGKADPAEPFWIKARVDKDA